MLAGARRPVAPAHEPAHPEDRAGPRRVRRVPAPRPCARVRRERGPLPRASCRPRRAALSARRAVERDVPCLLATAGIRPPREVAAVCEEAGVTLLVAAGTTGGTIARVDRTPRGQPRRAADRPRRADGHPRPRAAHHRGERHREERMRARPDRSRAPARRRRHRRGPAAGRDRPHRHLPGADAPPHGAPRPRARQRRGSCSASRRCGAPSASSSSCSSNGGSRAAAYERLGLDDVFEEILGVQVPMVRMPVAPGRSVATLVEVAARNQLLRTRGRHAARELARRLDDQLRRGDADPGPHASRPMTTRWRRTEWGDGRAAALRRHTGLPGRLDLATGGSSSSPGCPGPGSRRRSARSRISATSASTTCRRCSSRRSRACRSSRATSYPRWRSSWTCARGRSCSSSPACGAKSARIAGPAARADLPGGHPRRARAAVQRDTAPAPAGVRPAGHRGHPRRAQAARRHPPHGRRDHRHVGTDRARAAQPFMSLARVQSQRSPLIVTLLSFGFKHGVPLDADLVFDVRFLPNPHFVPGTEAADRQRSARGAASWNGTRRRDSSSPS